MSSSHAARSAVVVRSTHLTAAGVAVSLVDRPPWSVPAAVAPGAAPLPCPMSPDLVGAGVPRPRAPAPGSGAVDRRRGATVGAADAAAVAVRVVRGPDEPVGIPDATGATWAEPAGAVRA